MKQLFLIAALALGAAGCADDLRPIQLRNPSTLDKDCVVSNDKVSLYAGSLDVALADLGYPLENLRYVLSFNVASLLETPGTTVNGTAVADPTRNNFVAEEIELSYTSQPAHAFAAETVPAYFVIPAASEDSQMTINLVTPRALQAAKDLVDATGAPVTLIASFKLKGKLVSGQSAESNSVSFPITIYKSQFAGCPAGTTLAANGPCGGPGGQDGAPLTCDAASGQ